MPLGLLEQTWGEEGMPSREAGLHSGEEDRFCSHTAGCAP